MRTMYFVLLAVAIVLAGAYVLVVQRGGQTRDASFFSDPKSGTYIVSDYPVTLVNGYSREAAAIDSAQYIETQYFGNEARGDIDSDGDEDVVFLVTQSGSGTGTFYYLVGALRDGEKFRGTNAVYIGDRIAPQTTEFRDGLVIVNYADRKPEEPMVAPPSVGKSLYLKYSIDSNDFGEVVQNFEGESR